MELLESSILWNTMPRILVIFTDVSGGGEILLLSSRYKDKRTVFRLFLAVRLYGSFFDSMWKQNFPPKRRGSFSGPHDIIPQKIAVHSHESENLN
jgi:hypothetical protein